MDLKQELIELREYMQSTVDFIRDDDDERDRYSRQAYRDIIIKVEEILEREEKSTKEDSSLPIGDIRHRYFVVAYTGENSKGSFLGSVDIDCTDGYPSSASVIEYIKGLKSKPNNVIITDMRELTEEDYLAWCGVNDA